MSADQPAVEVPSDVVEYLGSQSTLTLATASPAGTPRASTFLFVNEGPSIYFWSRPDTATARHIEQNPMVSFAIDEYTGDLSQAKGLQGSGECSVILSGEEIARVADLFGQRFADLSPGNTMSISFFRIAPTELRLIDNSEGGSVAPQGTFGAEFHRQRSFSVYDDLPPTTGEFISAPLRNVTAEAGEVVAREGGPADKFLIVIDGALEVLRGPQEEQVATLGPGDLFGEVAIMVDKPRSATVRATERSTLLAIEHDTFRGIVAQSLGTTADFDRLIQARLESLGAGG